MNYKRLIIFWFSGTGNARSVAGWIREYATAEGLKTELHDLSRKEYPDISSLPENTMIGFCYPTHGFNAPPLVIKYIRKFPRGNCDIFLLNTRAGMKIWKIFTPGLSGIALFMPALIMRIKGYRVRGYRPMDMPSNWIFLHPGLRKKVVESIHARCKRLTKRFTQRILSGKLVSRGIFDLPLDIAVIPLTIGYYFYGRFAIAKTFYASYKCTDCGLCYKKCPVKAIKIKDGRPYWTFNCESCMHCINHCPERAIETAHAYTALLWWLAFSLIPYALIRFLVWINIIPSSFYNDHLRLLTNIFILVSGLITVFLGYRVLHFLLRFKLLNRLFTWTSLTSYSFWRRYKSTG
ncbi:MAG: EFR1 family ferrodoxin [Bacteroidales bacterium]|jgi:ferredoxin|nr:EFR1 family ferrodoxin [Bacteroidales bacterium]